MRRSEMRELDDLAALVAAPFWFLTWALTLGRFGHPLWTVTETRARPGPRPTPPPGEKNPRLSPGHVVHGSGGGGGVVLVEVTCHEDDGPRYIPGWTG